MSDELHCDPIDAPIAALQDLFSSELRELRFPDVDASTLDAAVLAVTESAEQVQRARAALERATDELRGRQRTLREHARLAYRYARVFASGNAELSATLDGISLDEPPPPVAKRRSGRRPKKATAAPQLNLDKSSAAPLPSADVAAG